MYTCISVLMVNIGLFQLKPVTEKLTEPGKSSNLSCCYIYNSAGFIGRLNQVPGILAYHIETRPSILPPDPAARPACQCPPNIPT